MKALIIDDDPEVQDVVSLCFEFEWPEMSIVVAGDGMTALDIVAREEPDIVILDLGLPDIDGFTVCEEIRKQSPVPILILSARDREADVVKGLQLGADDYITKPFSRENLLARTEALLRRAGRNQQETQFADGALHVDLERREVTVDGVPVKLTPAEYKLLSQLVINADKLVTHTELLEKVWGSEYLDAIDYLTFHIEHVRRKVGDSSTNPTIIVSDAGIGYRYVTSGSRERGERGNQ